ncbi:MAG: GAF domain-containing protein [Hyphomicrobiales bacterium]|nr:GAF domain-containing protein [Hyphomicrobiales bacterium]MCP4998924.1 GAF domain-containing protein [Hyphomicrobiales bacterium]
MERLEYPRILHHVAAGDSDALFRLAARRIKERIGYQLFTILAPDRSGTNLQRIYTTDMAGYPLGPADQIRKSPWFQQLFENKQPIIAANGEEIAAWLPDFDGFVGTDLGSLVNYPVVVSDETLGVINLMDSPESYGIETGRVLEQEVMLIAIAIATMLGPNGRR